MFFYISASSKDKKVLEKFSFFLSNIEKSTLILKYFSKQKKRKFVTILKSPHVNKTAQEQFEFRYYKKQFLINSLRPLTFLFFLKKMKNTSFAGLDLKVKSIVNDHEKNSHFLKLINPDNFIFKNKTFSSSRNLTTKKYIQLFDCYGEVFLKDTICRKDLS